ncbi:MAG: DUF488 domain-containing protein [Rhizobiales bacterium]|nr:DUF488 domain-containing protein [Hyphomicrobiales bacterium]
MSGMLFTIGYEKATADAAIGELKRAKVKLLVDVRAVAASRKPGFSKRQLSAHLDDAGIAYLHLQRLGTPAEGRAAARAGNTKTLWRIYGKHLRSSDVREALDELAAILGSTQRVCLLCYERDPAQCHRSRIAEVMAERTGITVKNLFPPLS